MHTGVEERHSSTRTQHIPDAAAAAETQFMLESIRQAAVPIAESARLTIDRLPMTGHHHIDGGPGYQTRYSLAIEVERAMPAGLLLNTARDALARGPVLVQVPRAGYVPVVACATCREPARCRSCQGPLRLESAGAARCGWCGDSATGWSCPQCRGTGFRAVRVGSQRTAEELGQAFPGVVVRSSGAATGILDKVGPRPQLVVATPGAEPRVEGGYAAALLLDAAVLTGRPSLDVGEQALRTWLAAAALVRPAGEGGQVLLVGDGAPVPTQALVRWDPAGHADRELAERGEIGLPPAAHLAVLTGPRDAVTALLGRLELPRDAVVLGPVAVGEPATDQLDPEATREVRALIRSPWARGPAVARALRAGVAARSAGGLTPVRVRLEPADV